MRAQKKALLMSTAFLRRYATTRRQPSLAAGVPTCRAEARSAKAEP